LNTKSELNSILAGYFAKIVKNLISNKKNEMYEYIVESKKSIVLIDHCNNISISDIIQALLKKIENIPENKATINYQAKIFQDLLFKLSNSFLNYEYVKSISKIFEQLLETENDYFDKLFSGELCNILHRFALENTKLNFGLAFSLISKFLKKINEGKKAESLDFDVSNFLKISHKFLFEILEKYLSMTINSSIIPATNLASNNFNPRQVLSLLNYLIEMMKVDWNQLWKYFEDHHIPKYLFLLIRKYPNVSMIHQRIFKIFKMALRTKKNNIISEFTAHIELAQEICDLVNCELKKNAKVFKKNSKKWLNPPWLIFILTLTEKLLLFSNYFHVIRNHLENDKNWKKYLTDIFLPFQQGIKTKISWDTKELRDQKKVTISAESVIENEEFNKFVLPKVEYELKNSKIPIPNKKFLESSNNFQISPKKNHQIYSFMVVHSRRKKKPY